MSFRPHFLCTLLLVSCPVFSGTVENAKIKAISSYDDKSYIGINIEPRPVVNYSDHLCTDDYWLILDRGEPAYETLLSMILIANTSQKEVDVSYDNIASGQSST